MDDDLDGDKDLREWWGKRSRDQQDRLRQVVDDDLDGPTADLLVTTHCPDWVTGSTWPASGEPITWTWPPRVRAFIRHQ